MDYPSTSLGTSPTLAMLLKGAQPSVLAQLAAQTAQSAPPGATPAQLQPQPQIAPPPQVPVTQAPVAQSPAGPGDITVAPSAPSQYRTGIIGGPFRVGSLGGNILGAIGDAFLVQHRDAPTYAPRLQNARESEALQSFTADPEEAIRRLTQIDPSKGMALRQWYNQDQQQTAEEQQKAALTTSQIIANRQQVENAVLDRVGGLLFQSDESTFPAALSKARIYMQQHGVDAPLPETWEEAKQWAQGGIPVDKQIEMADRRKHWQDEIAVGHEANAAKMTAAQAATIAAQASTTRANRPPNTTVSNQIAGVMAKIANGLPLTPGETQLYHDYRSPRAQPKGSGFRFVNGAIVGPDGKPVQ